MDEEEKEDLFVHATSEGGDAPQVDDCLVAVAVKRATRPPDEYETDSEEMTFLIGKTNILHRLPFQDWAPNTCPFSA